MYLLHNIYNILSYLLPFTMQFFLIVECFKITDTSIFKKVIPFVTILVGIIHLCTSTFYSWVVYVIVFIFSYFFFLYFYRIHVIKSFCLLLAYNGILFVSRALFAYVFSFFTNLSMEALAPTDTHIYLLYLFSCSLFQCAITFLLIRYTTANSSRDRHRQLLLLVTFLLNYIMVYMIHILTQSALQASEKNQDPTCIIIALLSLCFTALLLAFFQQIQNKQEEHLRNEYLTFQLHEQEKIAIENQKKYEELNIFRHDIKHLLTTYQQLLEINDLPAIKRSIDDYLQSQMANYLFDNVTDIIHALIYQYEQTCKEKKIPFQTHLSKDAYVNDIKISILLKNLLENAIEAEEKLPPDSRNIQLEISRYNQYYSIVIRNTILNSVLAQNPKLISTKALHTHLHGLGIKSVYTIVKEKKGIIDFYEENSYFCVHAMIPCSSV